MIITSISELNKNSYSSDIKIKKLYDENQFCEGPKARANKTGNNFMIYILIFVEN